MNTFSITVENAEQFLLLKENLKCIDWSWNPISLSSYLYPTDLKIVNMKFVNFNREQINISARWIIRDDY